MAKIKIADTVYDIVSIQPVALHVLQIEFVDAVPETWGDITTYTIGGMEAGHITGYDTVYRSDGQTVYLSNDGSVYVPPTEPPEKVEPEEPYAPTLEELQESKKREVQSDCEKIIYAGINVTLSDGSVEHFSLTEHDQINLFGKQAQLAAGVDQLEYHADGQLCRYYSAADMQTIIDAAMFHVSYHTTYCNSLNMWIAGCQTEDELQQIFYGADVPEEYQSEVLKTYLVKIASMTEDDNGAAES